jgi:hypothetical protein
MDLGDIIAQLHAERGRLDQAIAALEGSAPRRGRPPKVVTGRMAPSYECCGTQAHLSRDEGTMGSQKEKRIFSETGKSNGKEAFSSSPNEPCCEKETVCSDEGTMGGTQAAGESCVIGEPGSADYFQAHVIVVAALYSKRMTWALTKA